MMRSVRDTARTGHRGCRCCCPIPNVRTLRTRERRAWLKEEW
jgi:hypothetical protein